MPFSPHAYVQYDTGSHLHLVPLGDGRVCILEMEEAAGVLAEAVRACSPDKHNGKGQKHSDEDAELAYKAAIAQLLTKDFDAEYAQLERQRQLFKIWGGHAPAAVLMPTAQDARDWVALVPGKDGMPVTYKVRKNAIQDIIPPPDTLSKDLVVPDKQGIGWRVRKRRR